MSYRPICDVWILARPKVKYYGAYPNGFLERALPMISASDRDEVLHLCGGRVKQYPNRRLVANAKTVDADCGLDPDFVRNLATDPGEAMIGGREWHAVLIDPPYTAEDHANYTVQGLPMPTANHLLRVGLRNVKPGGKVGMLHYVWPQPPKTARSIACIGVIAGFNNRMRCFSVFERSA